VDEMAQRLVLSLGFFACGRGCAELSVRGGRASREKLEQEFRLSHSWTKKRTMNGARGVVVR
jgi:hypothetical protein